MPETLSTSFEKNSARLVSVALLTILYFFVSGWNLSIQQIEKPDEPRYVCAARDLALSDRSPGASDWVIPMFNGEPRIKKPILIYWALAVAGKIGLWLNMDLTTSFRCVPMLAGLLTVWALFGLARRLFSTRVGFLAGLILLTTSYYRGIVREIVIDPMLTAALIGSWYFFVCGLQRLKAGDSKGAGLPFLAMYVCLGIACLAKGPPLVAIFSVIPMVAYLIWDKEQVLSYSGIGTKESSKGSWRSLGYHSRLWYGVPLAIFIGMFWFFVLWQVGEWEAARLQIEQENLQRAAGNVDHNSGIRLYPFLFYVQNVPLHYLPWSLFLVPTIWWTGAQFKKRNSNGKLLACALFIPWFVMGVVGSKRSIYMLPLYPLIALWLAWAWDRIFLADDSKGVPKALRASWKNILVALIVIAILPVGLLAFGGSWLNEQGYLSLLRREMILSGVILVILLAIGWHAFSGLSAGKRSLPGFQIMFMVAILGFTQEATIRSVQEREEDKVTFFNRIKEKIGERPLIWLGGSGNEGSWYLNRVIYEVTPWNGLQHKFFESYKNPVLLMRGKEFSGKRGKRMAMIKDSVKVMSKLPYGKKIYYLLEVDPSRPPPKQIYSSPKRKGKVVKEVPWYRLLLSILMIVIFCGTGYSGYRYSLRSVKSTEEEASSGESRAT